MKMKKWQATVLVCASLVCLSACNNQMENQADKQNGDKNVQVSSQVAKKGEEVPNFELTGVDGKLIVYQITKAKSLSQILGFMVLYCLASLPDTDELAKEESDDYVVLTVVSPGQKGEQAEESFKKMVSRVLDYKKSTCPSRFFR